MRSSGVGRVAMGLAVMLAAACRGPAPAARHHQVVIEGMAFRPAAIVVMPGDTITWTNRDIVPHTASGPGAGWDTGNVAAGAAVTVVVGPGGRGEYRCAYHPIMTGQLLAP